MKILFLLSFFLILFSSCLKEPDQSNTITENPHYKRAFEFRDQGEADSAFLYYNQAKDIFLLQKDSLGVGKCLINMAIISTSHGDDFGGQELSLNAIPYFNAQIPAHHVYMKSNFNNLGIASYHLKKYKEAIEFYQESLDVTEDSLAALVVKNNIANAYQKEADYGSAIEIYEEILTEKMLPVDHARVMTNLAFTKWLQNPTYNPAPELLKALAIRQQELDEPGQVASYHHLSDYYLEKQPDVALSYAHQMYEIAKKLNKPDDCLEALKILIRWSPSAVSKDYFNRYQDLADSLQTTRSAAKNQFALIRYETEKHKADKLKLQKENNTRNTWIWSLIGFIIFGAVVLVFWYKRRKEKLALAAQNSIRESQLKTSKKVHDVVANGLYRLLSEIENGASLDRNKLLDEVDVLYEQSRDISHEEDADPDQNFQEVIKKLLTAFASENTKILISGNTMALWAKVNPEIKYELQQVLQELMVNMKKHSGASHVVIRFELLAGEVKVFYSDNGRGIPKEVTLGNGMRNTGNRINDIGGRLNFENGEKSGLKIQIQFPLPR